MTYEGSMAVCPLKRNDSYNPMRTPHLERSTEGFAEAKPDVPPSRTPEGRDEQFETALHASRLRPSLRAMASRIVSGQGYAAVSTLTPQQPEMRTSRLGRSVRDPEGKPRLSMSQAKHYVPPRSHESADNRDPAHAGWHGKDQVLVRSISKLIPLKGSTIKSRQDEALATLLPPTDQTAISGMGAHRINTLSEMSTLKNDTNASSGSAAESAADNPRWLLEDGKRVLRPMPLSMLQPQSPNGKNRPAMGEHELKERDRQYKEKLNLHAAREDAKRAADAICAQRRQHEQLERMRVAATHCLRLDTTSAAYTALPEDAQVSLREVDKKVAALQDVQTVPTNGNQTLLLRRSPMVRPLHCDTESTARPARHVQLLTRVATQLEAQPNKAQVPWSTLDQPSRSWADMVDDEPPSPPY
jgi:hypothetical protein